MTPPSLRFARYAAVSTREQKRPGKFSIPNQLEHTLAVGASFNWVETAGPFIVPGQSREKYIDLGDAEAEIPALREMLHAARLRQFDVLIVSETDRFRSLLMQVFRRLSQYQVQLYFLNLPIDPVAPDQYSIYKADHTLMMLTMSQMTSSLEISRTRRKWFENMPKRITELGLPATSIAWGYHKPHGSHTDSKAVPEPDPLLSPVLVTMKNQLLSGHSTRQIVSWLEEHKIKPPKSGRWYPQTVREILRNPFYAGVVRFGASRVVIDPLTDRKKRDRSIAPERVQIGQGRHVPLWDLATHQQILLELKRRSRNYRGRANNQFTALLVCGICAQRLWRQGNGPRAEGGLLRLIWRCSGNGSAHGHINIPHITLLEKIAFELKTLPEQSPTPLGRGQGEGTPDTWNLKLETVLNQLTRLEDAYLAGAWDLPRYTTRKKELDLEIQSLRDQQLETELAELTRAQNVQALKELQAIPDLPTWLKTSDPNEVNHRLRLLIDHITVSPEAIKITLK